MKPDAKLAVTRTITSGLSLISCVALCEYVMNNVLHVC